MQVLHGISLTVAEGSFVAVLGANGAGKTTLLRAVSGLVRRSGDISLDGRRIDRLAPDRVARLGVAHVPEGRGTFTELSVAENLRLGAHTRSAAEARETLATVHEYFPWLAERRSQAASTLSGGEQQMLALARALMARPRLLMIDEPSLGLAPMVVRELFRILADLNAREGLTVLVVEQNASIALRASERAVVLEAGRVALEGESDRLREDESVRRAYLGY